MRHVRRNTVIISLLAFVAAGNFFFFVTPFTITRSGAKEPATGSHQTLPHNKTPLYEGDHVIVHLDTMAIELRNGSTVITTLPLVSQGKPGSYYETIGGVYKNDYKIPLHFSSIGHVYMPYSVHIFGNYFIHGIPYYPNGDRVSSAYSGGCIRLADKDAETLYTFVKRGTPIVITRGSEVDFTPTSPDASTIASEEMTRLMVATISLEVLTQDSEIYGLNDATTTRRKLLPELLTNHSNEVPFIYADSLGRSTFVELMNQKARTLGLSNTTFTYVTEPATTSQEDYDRFIKYITTYKSYLNTIPR